jgi:thymidylate kinase
VKIAFIGTHGVGKTTLCYDLAACLKKRDVTVELVREVARECPLPINKETTLTAQSWILHTQIAWELAAEAKSEVVVCDRATLDNFCYLKRAGGAGAREDALASLVASWTPTYDMLVKVPICGALKFDGVRDTDIAFQRDIDEMIDGMLERGAIPHLALDPSNREGWIGAVLGKLLPVLRPQEMLFPEAGASVA